MKMLLILSTILSFSAMANEIRMTKSEYDLGNISDQETNRPLFK